MENSFTQWATDKKMKDSDLHFTSALKLPQHQEIFKVLTQQFAELRPSFTEGLSILELLTDLILMGHTEDLFLNSATLPSWQLQLHHLRFPVTSKNDSLLKTKFENLPWPQGAKVKFERRGDRAGAEVKFFVSSSTDLTKLMAALERVQEEFNR